MRSRQKEINRVDAELERRSQEIRELQSRLQDAEKILVRNNTVWFMLDFVTVYQKDGGWEDRGRYGERRETGMNEWREGRDESEGRRNRKWERGGGWKGREKWRREKWKKRLKGKRERKKKSGVGRRVGKERQKARDGSWWRKEGERKRIKERKREGRPSGAWGKGGMERGRGGE